MVALGKLIIPYNEIGKWRASNGLRVGIGSIPSIATCRDGMGGRLIVRRVVKREHQLRSDLK
jgi:hypothetical protein